MIARRRWSPHARTIVALAVWQIFRAIQADAQGLSTPPSPGDQPPFALRLPTLARCDATAPRLPPRWRAVGVLASFKDGQLHVGEFERDGELMRATIYGLEQGSADLLITDTDTYQLIGPHQAPTACVPLGRRYSPPADRWLSADAHCTGTGTIAGVRVEWWEMRSAPSLSGVMEQSSDTPSAVVADGARDSKPAPATWIWSRPDTQLPWRAMFSVPTREPPVIGEFAQTQFTTFEPVASTDLPALRDLCRARAPVGASSTSTIGIVDMVAARRGEAAETERRARLEQLVPSLNARSCAVAKPLQWPRRFALTAMITPNAFGYGPFSAAVLYDAEHDHGLLTQLHDPHDPASRLPIASLLLPTEGYDIRPQPPSGLVCRAGYPGTVRPDWMAQDKCRCRGVAAPGSAFGTDEAVQIMSCPTDRDSVFWAIYGDGGRPLAFRATAPNMGGLALADYDQYAPGGELPPAVLQLPASCRWPKDAEARPEQRAAAARHRSENCGGCHMVSPQ